MAGFAGLGGGLREPERDVSRQRGARPRGGRHAFSQRLGCARAHRRSESRSAARRSAAGRGRRPAHGAGDSGGLRRPRGPDGGRRDLAAHAARRVGPRRRAVVQRPGSGCHVHRCRRETPVRRLAGSPERRGPVDVGRGGSGPGRLVACADPPAHGDGAQEPVRGDHPRGRPARTDARLDARGHARAPVAGLHPPRRPPAGDRSVAGDEGLPPGHPSPGPTQTAGRQLAMGGDGEQVRRTGRPRPPGVRMRAERHLG